MKIGLRGGHSPNCKGAIGLIDEQAEVRKIYNELAPMLQAVGHTVVDCNSNASNVSGELSDGTNKANSAGCDIYVTLHMNAAGAESAGGTEVWLYDASNQTMNTIASNICQNFANKGFTNRGVKYSSGYHDLNASNMPGMIVETLFCTGADDVARYRNLGTKGIAGLIAKAIDSRASACSEQKKSEYRNRTGRRRRDEMFIYSRGKRVQCIILTVKKCNNIGSSRRIKNSSSRFTRTTMVRTCRVTSGVLKRHGMQGSCR